MLLLLLVNFKMGIICLLSDILLFFGGKKSGFNVYCFLGFSPSRYFVFASELV